MHNTRIDLSAPDGLQRLFDRNRALYGGARMMADEGGSGAGDAGEGSGGGDTNDAPSGDDTKGGDEPLGEGGKRALQAERDARKQLEQQVTQMQQAQKDQMSAIAKAFGVKPEKGDDDGTQLVQTLQQQVAQMQWANTVATVAREHEITAADDVALLDSAKDEDGMRKIAARLKAASTPVGPTTPKPDSTQGGKSGDSKPDVKPGMGRLRAAYADTSNSS